MYSIITKYYDTESLNHNLSAHLHLQVRHKASYKKYENCRCSHCQKRRCKVSVQAGSLANARTDANS